MALKIPPAPTGSPPGSAFWNDWYEKLRNLINSGTIASAWSSLDFTGSNISDIAARDHASLQTFQGGTSGERYHLTQAQHTTATSVISLAGLPTTAEVAAGTWAVYKDTSGGTVRIWANDGGVMKSATLT